MTDCFFGGVLNVEMGFGRCSLQSLIFSDGIQDLNHLKILFYLFAF